MNKYTLGPKQWRQAIDHAVKRTAAEMSVAMEHMTSQLPKDVPPRIAIGLVVRELTATQPGLLQLIMEDPEIKECYWVASAESRY